jgi:putative FmdB family regulatory protein
MPTYEYTCAACRHDFERFESIVAKPNKSCPKCQKKKAERRISVGGGFLFKGTGFYVTDYKKAGSAKPAESKSEPAKASECKSNDSSGACNGPCSDAKSTKKSSTKVA